MIKKILLILGFLFLSFYIYSVTKLLIFNNTNEHIIPEITIEYDGGTIVYYSEPGFINEFNKKFNNLKREKIREFKKKSDNQDDKVILDTIPILNIMSNEVYTQNFIQSNITKVIFKAKRRPVKIAINDNSNGNNNKNEYIFSEILFIKEKIIEKNQNLIEFRIEQIVLDIYDQKDKINKLDKLNNNLIIYKNKFDQNDDDDDSDIDYLDNIDNFNKLLDDKHKLFISYLKNDSISSNYFNFKEQGEGIIKNIETEKINLIKNSFDETDNENYDATDDAGKDKIIKEKWANLSTDKKDKILNKLKEYYIYNHNDNYIENLNIFISEISNLKKQIEISYAKLVIKKNEMETNETYISKIQQLEEEIKKNREKYNKFATAWLITGTTITTAGIILTTISASLLLMSNNSQIIKEDKHDDTGKFTYEDVHNVVLASLILTIIGGTMTPFAALFFAIGRIQASAHEREREYDEMKKKLLEKEESKIKFNLNIGFACNGLLVGFSIKI